MKKGRPQGERSHLYLVCTSTGYFGIYDAQQAHTTIISKDQREAEIALRKWQYPEKEKIPYQRGLSEMVDELIDGKEQPEAKPVNAKYIKNTDRLKDPAIAAILAGVVGRDRQYFKNGVRYPVLVELTKLTGSDKISSRLIDAAWAADIITGDRVRRRKKPDRRQP